MPLKPYKTNEENPVLNPSMEMTSLEENEEVEVEEVENLPENLQDILSSVGLASKSIKDSSDIRKIFNDKGAGIEEIAAQVAMIMSRGESEATRLKACQMAMEVQGILSTIEEKQVPEIQINITNQFGSKNLTVINLVCPEDN